MSEFRSKNVDEVFCRSCGSVIKKEAEICPKCGVRQMPAPNTAQSFNMNSEMDHWTMTLLLCLIAFFGVAGIHRFYNGKIVTGVLMLITFGFCGLWTLIDIILIASNQFTDAKGNIISRGNRAL
ncbi:TM2 domain-containing protein [Leptospira sarikeiensis]|uniref:TM2 domain-containing protein n=1 Tax=Leptospira sarikeiensis TaxID=2484943 RepID=A0A4R9K350_9LEPT|nr:TM2 domain-containing protein [Leptospira sarikeiensis]TGL58738.1 TM2 domain-containing protein [Leptospira sarikeiensis]